MASMYAYQPLGEHEIRVLCLHPGRRGEALHARFENLQLPTCATVRFSWIGSDYEDSSDGELDCSGSGDGDFASEPALVAHGCNDRLESQGQELIVGDSGRSCEGDHAGSRPDDGTENGIHAEEGDEDEDEDEDEEGEEDPDEHGSYDCDSEETLPSHLDIPRIHRYEAISYVWGDPDPTHSISLPNETSLLLTTSLYEALCRFRSSRRIRRLWADAVCINQADIDERNAQVAIMGRIYRCSSRTLAWLGPGSDTDAAAFALIWAMKAATNNYELYGAKMNIAEIRPQLLVHLSPSHRERWAHLTDVLPEGMKALMKLFRRSWFSRLWIVQESSRATTGAVEM